ncbi:hypothetical protein GCM10020256_74290 [Streptomyces thermocoprophilus]
MRRSASSVKDGDLAGADKESQEVSMLALHLLQSALVHVNTLLMQQVLADPKWADTLTDADRRALSPLFWRHMNPYGRFELDMNSRLELDLAPHGQCGSRPAPPRERERDGPRMSGPGECAAPGGRGTRAGTARAVRRANWGGVGSWGIG